MHPWHDIELGDNFPLVVPAVVEIPKDSKGKYCIDKKTGILKLDHMLLSAVRFPINYGFIPRTFSSDNDPLDIMVVNQEPVFSLSLVMVKPIGGIELKSSKKGSEYKIIGVDANDPESAEIESIKDLPPHVLDEICQFFETYKALKHEHIKVTERFGKGKAKSIIEECADAYREKLVAA